MWLFRVDTPHQLDRSETEGRRSKRTQQLHRDCLDHLDALYRTALRLTRNPDQAEDLVQETYLRAIRSADQLGDPTNCKAWLFRILTNRYIDGYRREQRAPDQVALEGIEERLPDPIGQDQPFLPSDRSLAAYLHKVADDAIRRAVEGLPDSYRMAVVLADMEGFSYREIGQILGIPVGTVMSRLYRGRRFLKDALTEYAKERGYGPT